MVILKKAITIVLLQALLLFSGAVTAQSQNQELFDQTVDYINCRIAQLSLQEQDNGRAPHFPAFQARFQCGESQSNADLLSFLQEKNLALNVRLNNSVNEFKEKFSPALSKAELISLLEDDLLEVRLEAFASNRVDSYNILRNELSEYIRTKFREFDKKQVEEEEIKNEPVVEKPKNDQPIPSTPADISNESEDSNRGMGFLVWMVIGAFLGALLYNLFLRYFRRDTAMSAESNDLRAFRNKNNALQNELENLRLQNSSLINEVTALKKEIMVLSAKALPDSGDLKTGLEEEE